MAEYFKRMSEEYKQKHFPKGTIFGTLGKNVKRNGIIAVILFFGPMFLLCCFGLVMMTISTIQTGVKEDEVGLTIGFYAVLGVLALLFLVAIICFLRMGKRGADHYIKTSAKNSKLTETEIRSFESQALASDCYILNLTSGLKRALNNNFMRDGLLTREYIYLSDPRQTVIRVQDLKACFFEEYITYINNKRIYNLGIRLIASNGVMSFADASEEAGNALMDMLLERNSSIDTNNRDVLQEGKELDNYVKKMLG